MPTLPPGLTDWLPSGFFTALLGLIWYEVKASEARQQEALKASEARQQEALKAMVSLLREDLKASETRQREDVQALRKDVNDLPLKIVQLLRKVPQ